MHAGSAIHAADWAALLRARALAPPPPPDREALLARFATRDAFYRSRIDARGWAAVPPLGKAEVAAVPVVDDGSIRPARTSGTTGVQVTILNTLVEREFRRALLYRPQLFCELPRVTHQLVFVDGDACMAADAPPKRFDYGGVRYRTWFAGVGAEPSTVLRLARAIRPALVRGIASGIVRFVDACGGSLAELGIRYVGPGGEWLRPEWRARIAEAFGARVLDRYGSTETGALAWQCPLCEGYHANVDEVLIEDDPDGLIATPLFVASQPLLRYRLGDMVRLGPPVAGCPVRLPSAVIAEARRDDWIVGADGRRISPLGFQFEQVPRLEAWRLHQAADGSLVLYFESPVPDEVAPRLRAMLERAVPGRPVRCERGIWRAPGSGKFKRVSSALGRVM